MVLPFWHDIRVHAAGETTSSAHLLNGRLVGLFRNAPAGKKDWVYSQAVPSLCHS